MVALWARFGDGNAAERARPRHRAGLVGTVPREQPRAVPGTGRQDLPHVQGRVEARHALRGHRGRRRFPRPYRRLSDQPYEAFQGCEDPCVWYEDGAYHALAPDHHHRYSDKEILYLSSADLKSWSADGAQPAISKRILFEDGTVRRMEATERPQIVLDDGGTRVLSALPRRPTRAASTIRGTWSSRSARDGGPNQYKKRRLPGGQPSFLI